MAAYRLVVTRCIRRDIRRTGAATSGISTELQARAHDTVSVLTWDGIVMGWNGTSVRMNFYYFYDTVHSCVLLFYKSFEGVSLTLCPNDVQVNSVISVSDRDASCLSNDFPFN